MAPTPLTSGSVSPAVAEEGDIDCPAANTQSEALILLEDGASVASRVQSDVLRLILDAAEPAIAGGIVFFGLGAVVLPLVAALRGSGGGHSIYSYREHCYTGSGLGLHFYTEKELKEHFGLVDIAFKMKELTLDAAALELHMSQSSPQTLKREVRDIRRWRESARVALKLFQRRAALSYLGLASDASEVDISKVYKKLALELHPDKGGDPLKFHTLQEMRQRTLDNDKGEPHVENEDDRDEEIDDKRDLKLLRWEAHRSVVQLWQDVKGTTAEINVVLQDEPWQDVKGNATEVLHMLRTFVLSFVRSEMGAVAEAGACHSVEAKLAQLAKMGAELIAVSSVLDPKATHSILATHLGSFIVAGSGSSEARRMYGALLQATTVVKTQVGHMLTTLDDALLTRHSTTLEDALDDALDNALDDALDDALGLSMLTTLGDALDKTLDAPQRIPPDQPVASAEANCSQEARCQVLVSTHTFQSGQKLEYLSASIGEWILVKVLEVNPQGDARLNVKSHRWFQPNQVGTLLRVPVAAPSTPDAEPFPASNDREHQHSPNCSRTTHSEIPAATNDVHPGVSARCPRGAPPQLAALFGAGFEKASPQDLVKEFKARGFTPAEVVAKLQDVAKLQGLKLTPLHPSNERAVDHKMVDQEEEQSIEGTWMEVSDPYLVLSSEPQPEQCNADTPDTGLDTSMQFGTLESRLSAATRVHEIMSAQIPEDENVLTFAPPPFQLGPYQMTLQMVDRGTWEELRVDLWEGTAHLGNLQGTYILRGSGAFLDACCSGGVEQDYQASLLFDEDGCPTACWKNRVGARAWTGGLVLLERISAEHQAMLSVAPDLIRAVLQCLAGPMKRVTLAMWVDGAMTVPSQNETLSLKDVCARMGFQRAVEGQDDWFAEVGPSKARARQQSKAKLNKQTAAKRSHHPENTDKENAAVPSKRMKVDVEQQPAFKSGCINPDRVVVGAFSVPLNDWEKLTPRVRYALATATEIGVAALQADAARFVSGKPGGDYWGCESFPKRLQQHVFKAYVKGFADIVSVIGGLLRCQQAPTVEAISRVISPFGGQTGEELGLQINRHFVSHFSGVGGTVESVLLAVVREASALYDACECIKGKELSLERAFREGASKGHHSLPIHMLDGDFEFVKSVLAPDINRQVPGRGSQQ